MEAVGTARGMPVISTRAAACGYSAARVPASRMGAANSILSRWNTRPSVHLACGVRRAALVVHEGQRVLAVEGKLALDTKGLAQRLTWAQLDRVQVVGRIPLDRRHNAKVDYPGLMKILRRE
jgi:olefin beta-lactone synthetase